MKTPEIDSEIKDTRPRHHVPYFAGGALIDPPHNGVGAHDDYRIYGPNGNVSRFAIEATQRRELPSLTIDADFPTQPDHDWAA